MSTTLTESLALAGIDELTRATLRQTWPLIRDGVALALQVAMAPAAGKQASGQPSEEQLEAARQIQARHWEALFAAEFDEGYAASVRELAAIHAKVGLDPSWLIAGYMTTLTELHSLVLAAHANAMMTWSARSRLERAIRAVDQAVLFDLQLCMSAYTEQLAATMREKVLEVARQLQQQPPVLTPQLAAARSSANGMFVAAQRRTFIPPTGAAMPGRHAEPSVTAAAAAQSVSAYPT